MTEAKIYDAGAFVLQSGLTLPDAKIAYVTYGELNAAKDNVIVYPTRYAGTHNEQPPLIGEGKALDPTKYFIIVPNTLGNGASSSPSNTPAPLGGPDFPLVTHYDNVILQERMLKDLWGIEEIRLVCGWSMGGQQSYHWAAIFPDRVRAMSCFCGQAITAPHTHVFLEGVKYALITDPAWMNGYYREQPWRGFTAQGRVWAGWALSQEWYRREMWRELGFSSLEDYLKRAWDGAYFPRDANDMLSLIATWQACDISDNPIYEGDRAAALGSITAKAIIMPGRTDFYFPPEDNAAEVAQMPNAELRVIESVWGHYAGGGRAAEDTAFVNAALKELLA
ncbi:alpha/beta fold hydrolase [Psychromarinibacter sp. S121]|uniref:alpha/beta fold hydrolase n=1 Tax=Psychromarinibacter sp. S121 TaxID=3415127 RepID=UPI003C79D868